MDGGSFRGSRPNERVVNRSESSRRQPAESPQPVTKEEPVAPIQHEPKKVAHGGHKKRSRSRLVTIVSIVLSILILLVIIIFSWSSMTKTSGTGIDANTYQAVFFEDGSVYFGKLESFNDDYYKMTGAYYPQTQTTQDDGTQQVATDSNTTLLKLSNQVHGPDELMYISKDKVLFFQNLTSDSQVTRLIEQQSAN